MVFSVRPFFTGDTYIYHDAIAGSRLVNPFGIFGAPSKSIRERMVSRYGYIPGSATMDGRVHNLSLFLSDFVVDTGPLYKRDEDMLNEEGGDVRDRDNKSDSSAVVLDPGWNSNDSMEIPLMPFHGRS